MKTKLIKKIMSLAIAATMVIGMSATGVSAEWKKGNNGWWNAKGHGYSIGWENVGGNWFFFDKDGYMKTGWVSEGGKWYFLNPNGYMATGWLQSGNKWYYLNPTGDMAYNAFIAGYQLGADGAWSDGDLINGTTTGAAVNITTGPAVIIIPEGNLHKENKAEEKLNKYLEKLDEKLDKKIEKFEWKEEKKNKDSDR